MLSMISVKTFTKRLKSNEIARFITIPSMGYEDLQADFDHANHLESIKDIDCSSSADGVLIKSCTNCDGMLGIVYKIRTLAEGISGERVEGVRMLL